MYTFIIEFISVRNLVLFCFLFVLIVNYMSLSLSLSAEATAEITDENGHTETSCRQTIPAPEVTTEGRV